MKTLNELNNEYFIKVYDEKSLLNNGDFRKNAKFEKISIKELLKRILKKDTYFNIHTVRVKWYSHYFFPCYDCYKISDLNRFDGKYVKFEELKRVFEELEKIYEKYEKEVKSIKEKIIEDLFKESKVKVFTIDEAEEEINEEVLESELEEFARDIYNKADSNYEDPYYSLTKYIWVKYQNGEEKRLDKVVPY